MNALHKRKYIDIIINRLVSTACYMNLPGEVSEMKKCRIKSTDIKKSNNKINKQFLVSSWEVGGRQGCQCDIFIAPKSDHCYVLSPCHSPHDIVETLMMWPWCVKMPNSCDLSLLMLNWIVGFVKVVTCISRPMPNKTKLKVDQYFEKVLNWIVGFFKVVTWICQSCYKYCSLPNKTKL